MRNEDDPANNVSCNVVRDVPDACGSSGLAFQRTSFLCCAHKDRLGLFGTLYV
jgi:hypothetical protein